MTSPSDQPTARATGRPRRWVIGVLAGVAAWQLVTGLGQPAPATSGSPLASASVADSPGPVSGAIVPSLQPGSGADPQPSSGPDVSGEAPAPPGEAAAPPGEAPGPPAAPAVLPGAGPSRVVLSMLDAHLEAVRAANGIPGISATILFRDGTRWTGTSGLADVEAGIAVRPGTPFAIASISKTFTAALILRLVEQRRLSLTDSAAALLAGLEGVAIDRRITVTQLLDHTSGLSDFFLNPKIEPAFAAAPDARWTPDMAMAFVGRPVAPPGARYYYSNTNYLLLGLIAERIGGEPLGTQLRQQFFEPLGLRTATYQGLEAPFVPLARAYRFTGGAPDEIPTPVGPATGMVPFAAPVTASGGAGSVAASSPDVAAWARALYSGRVLGPMMTATMIADGLRETAVDPLVPYGFGVSAAPVDGHASLGHSGRYLGARSAVRHFPIDGLTIAVLTNQSRRDPQLVMVDLLRLGVLAQAAMPPGDGEG